MSGKKKTERTKIWLVGGEKGGMGKSMVGRVAAEQLLAAKVPFHLIDADASTPNVGLTYAKEMYERFRSGALPEDVLPTLFLDGKSKDLKIAEQITFSGDDSTYLQADRILLLAEQKNVLVVLPSQVAAYVQRWLNDNDVLGMLADSDNTIDIVHFFVSNGTAESLDLFEESANNTQGKIPHVLVLNHGVVTDINWKWFDYDKSVSKYLEEHKFKSLVIPELLLDPAVKSKILTEYISFGDALKANWMPKPSARRLNKWLREATQALASSDYLPYHPNYPSEPVVTETQGDNQTPTQQAA
jgi:hypothetical protein